jgi:hypothetical protein
MKTYLHSCQLLTNLFGQISQKNWLLAKIQPLTNYSHTRYYYGLLHPILFSKGKDKLKTTADEVYFSADI